MNTDKHPDIDTLKAYSHDYESSEYAALRMHLAVCESCRDEVDLLSALDATVFEAPNTQLNDTADTPDGLSDAQHQLIMDFVDGSLAPEQHASVDTLVKDDPDAMKAALHYASHRAAMSRSLAAQESIGSTSATQANNQNGVSLASRISDFITESLSMRAPLWATVPATAFTVAIVIFSLQTSIPELVPDSDRLVVASFQDNPVIQIRDNDSLPGIGFFSKAARTSKAYNNVSIDVADNMQVKIQWPHIENAKQYVMRLQIFEQGEKRILGEMTTTTNTAAFQLDDISDNHRYEWVLSGSTDDQKTFYTTGGFVISRSP